VTERRVITVAEQEAQRLVALQKLDQEIADLQARGELSEDQSARLSRARAEREHVEHARATTDVVRGAVFPAVPVTAEEVEILVRLRAEEQEADDEQG
jgi:hypothetical protein